MYYTWKYKKLKEELKIRGRDIDGKKAELIDRLEAYDQANNKDEGPGKQMDLPKAELYEDVNDYTNLPKFKRNDIQSYFDRFGKSIYGAVNFYESKCLLVLRSLKSGQYTFLKGFCKASRKLQYEINIKMDANGVPQEASCECCSQGNTAHCKHVVAVLLEAEYIVQKKIKHTTEVPKLKKHGICKQAKKYAVQAPAKKPPNKNCSSLYSKHVGQSPNLDLRDFRCRFQSMVLNYQQAKPPFKRLHPPVDQRAVGMDHDFAENITRPSIQNRSIRYIVIKEKYPY